MIPVPSFALRFAMGEMAEETALASQRVRPHRLLEANFHYQQPTLDKALRHLLTER
jgi:NAD dependent epimerase/dehydratase family enzyme